MTKSINYTYKSAVKRIEEFMEESGIRNYCENYCKGDCCGGCYERDTACHQNEGRRLACSIYMCSNLSALVFGTPDSTSPFWTKGSLHERYTSLGFAIRKQLSKANGPNNQYSNLYFVPYTKGQMERFRIPKSVFDEGLPTKKETQVIRNTISALISLIQRASMSEKRRSRSTQCRTD